MGNNEVVLLVDDDQICHQIVKAAVESLGYSFYGLRSGSDLPDAVAALRPSALLLDLVLPGESGFDLCSRLQADPAARDIPVIFVTVQDNPADLDEAFRRGAVDYVVKPFRSEELRARVRTHVSLYQSRQKLERETRIKTKLFSLISHDLRSPFSSMIGVLQLLSGEGQAMPERDRQEFIAALLDNSRQQLSLLDNLMYWSRGQSDRIKPSLRPLPLAALAAAAAESLREYATQKQVALSVAVPGDVQVLADPELARVVVRNIAHNAVKFSQAGSAVKIYASPVIAAGMPVGLLVEDEGPGMDLLGLDEASARFESTPGSAGERGAGIGLNISFALAARMGCAVRFLKSDASGTVASVDFPGVGA